MTPGRPSLGAGDSSCRVTRTRGGPRLTRHPVPEAGNVFFDTPSPPRGHRDLSCAGGTDTGTDAARPVRLRAGERQGFAFDTP